MREVIMDTLLDTVKLLPYLYVTFLIIELLEDKLTAKSHDLIIKANNFGPIWGSILGLLPQCGFSVMATNLYVTRMISVGTLVSIYLTTSDEMLPIMLSSGVPFSKIAGILAVKLAIGLVAGLILNIFFPYKKDQKEDYSLCEEEDCHCEEKGPFLAALKHTLNIAAFILIITLIINIIIEWIGMEAFQRILLVDSFWAPMLAALIGMIPNCAASVILTQLYLAGTISFSMAISGLLVNSGVAFLVLFRNNRHHLKENLAIVGLMYVISVVAGMIISLF